MRRGRVALLLVVALVGVLVAAGSLIRLRSDFEQVTEPGQSMAPTYTPGSHLTIQKGSGAGAHRGDAVLLTAPEWGRPEMHLMRVIGVGGDHVVLPTTGPLRINGRTVHEPYVSQGQSNLLTPVDITVPAGRVFLLGDHRADSVDSRMHLELSSGTLPASDIRGRVVSDGTAVPYLAVAGAGALVALAGAVGALVTFLSGRRRPRPPAWGPTAQVPPTAS